MGTPTTSGSPCPGASDRRRCLASPRELGEDLNIDSISACHEASPRGGRSEKRATLSRTDRRERERCGLWRSVFIPSPRSAWVFLLVLLALSGLLLKYAAAHAASTSTVGLPFGATLDHQAGVYLEDPAAIGLAVGQLAGSTFGLALLALVTAGLAGGAWSSGLIGTRVVQAGRRPTIVVRQWLWLVAFSAGELVVLIVLAELLAPLLRAAYPLHVAWPGLDLAIERSASMLGRALLALACWSALGVGLASAARRPLGVLRWWAGILIANVILMILASEQQAPWLRRLCPVGWTATWLEARRFGLATHLSLLGAPAVGSGLGVLESLACLGALGLGGLALAWWNLSRSDIALAPGEG